MKTSFLIILLMVGITSSAQIVNIPDANFKAKLLSSNSSNTIAYIPNQYIAIDTNGNGEIEVSEAAVITRLDVSNSSINSLEGISAFTALVRLNCSNNNLTELNVNASVNLSVLNCSHNALATLNAKQINNKFSELNCSYNNLTSFIVPNFFQFQDMGYQTMALDCSHNQLSQITFNQNGGHEDLSDLNLSHNNFTDLHLTNILVYGSVNISNNPLYNLSFGSFYIGEQFAEQDVFLLVENTNLAQLTVPMNGHLFLSIKNNPNLVSIDMKNGSPNAHFYTYYVGEEEFFGVEGVTLENNPLLSFICCDEGEVNYLESLAPEAQVTEYCTFTPGGNYNTVTGSVNLNCPDNDSIDSSNIKIIVNNTF